MLALDPPLGEGGAATIGGVVATADSGPLRHRYGAPRDLVLGMTIALADGTVARSGGKVIKNVAGYDLAKLFSGLVRDARPDPPGRRAPAPAARRRPRTAVGRSRRPGRCSPRAAAELAHARSRRSASTSSWADGHGRRAGALRRGRRAGARRESARELMAGRRPGGGGRPGRRRALGSASATASAPRGAAVVRVVRPAGGARRRARRPRRPLRRLRSSARAALGLSWITLAPDRRQATVARSASCARLAPRLRGARRAARGARLAGRLGRAARARARAHGVKAALRPDGRSAPRHVRRRHLMATAFDDAPPAASRS